MLGIRSALAPLRLLLIACFLIDSVASGQQKQEIRITEGGVGAINARTPFSIASIGRMFPAYKVITGVISRQGIDFPTIMVFNRGFELFEIIPNENFDGIKSVIVKNPEVTLSGKGRIGSFYSDVYGSELSGLCYPGREVEIGFVLCRRSTSSHIGFIFDGISDGQPNSTLPPVTALVKSRVKEIFWTPSRE